MVWRQFVRRVRRKLSESCDSGTYDFGVSGRANLFEVGVLSP